MSTKNRTDIAPDDWISPAEAARLRGVTRQAITKLIRTGRVATLQIGGRNLVKRADIANFQPRTPGRRKKRKPPNGKSR